MCSDESPWVLERALGAPLLVGRDNQSLTSLSLILPISIIEGGPR